MRHYKIVVILAYNKTGVNILPNILKSFPHLIFIILTCFWFFSNWIHYFMLEIIILYPSFKVIECQFYNFSWIAELNEPKYAGKIFLAVHMVSENQIRLPEKQKLVYFYYD